jgi:transposase
MTEQEARALFQQGEEPVVKTLLEQDARIRELQAQCSLNSHNSSKPPSTDGYHKPAPKSRRIKTGRKPGGQKGHRGSTLGFTRHPDRIIVHPVEECIHCGLDLSALQTEKVETRQTHDIPTFHIEVTEDQYEIKRCPRCHGITSSLTNVPEGSAPVQYGPRIKALAVYLKTYQMLPFKRCAQFIRTLFGGTLSEGTIANMVKSVSKTLDTSLKAITDILTGSNVVHFDETGASVLGKLNWFHVASNEKATLYGMYVKRGADAMIDMGILPKFSGRAIHDHWKPYYTFANCTHGLCNAHHLRELTFIHEVVGQDWARAMKELLIQADALVHTAKKEQRSSLENEEIRGILSEYEKIIAQALAVNPKPELVPGKRGKPKHSKAGNLASRLKDHQDEVLAFMYDFAVPFTNNHAEREIRMMKVQQKVSGTFRSQEGATIFCRIRSYLASANKHEMNPFMVLSMASSGSPFTPNIS